MIKPPIVALVTLTSLSPIVAQEVGRLQLAHLLASDKTREETVAGLSNSGRDRVPLLLSLAASPPAHLERYQLNLGLSEAFGKLRTTEAIPFLIKNINLQYWPESPDTLTKTADVIKSRMPAVAALIEIGPAATRALISSIGKMTPQERLGAIFVISQDGAPPEAREFLTSVAGQSNLEHHWAEVGLRRLDANPPPK